MEEGAKARLGRSFWPRLGHLRGVLVIAWPPRGGSGLPTSGQRRCLRVDIGKGTSSVVEPTCEVGRDVGRSAHSGRVPPFLFF